MGIIAGGAPLAIVKNEEMNMFLEVCVGGEVPSPESIYNSIAFPIEQKMLQDVRFYQRHYPPGYTLANNRHSYFERL